VAQGKIRSDAWGRIVTIADPFGHGICLVHSLAGDGEATTEAG
jgi:hypothetical protein